MIFTVLFFLFFWSWKNLIYVGKKASDMMQFSVLRRGGRMRRRKKRRKVNFPRHQMPINRSPSFEVFFTISNRTDFFFLSSYTSDLFATKVQKKNCISRKWRRREETLLLFFFMRPMTLMLDANFFSFPHRPETSPECLATLNIFHIEGGLLILEMEHTSIFFSYNLLPLPVSQKTKNLMMHHLHGSAVIPMRVA